jgi:methyltransferase (TIGR00027 family)
MSLTLPIESVGDTSFLTAFCRALESERPDAYFRDPFARLLAGDRGERLIQRLPGGAAGASGCIVRTVLFDAFIAQAFSEAPIDTVVNFGAGLDTRPYRLPLAAPVTWIEVDSAAVLEYKASKLAGHQPGCRLRRVPLDVTDSKARRQFLQETTAQARQVLVLTEGLLIYMTREQVASFACDLHEHLQVQCWLSDLSSPTAFRVMGKLLAQSPQTVGQTQFQFAPEEGVGFFQPFGWECAEYRSCLEEGKRLDRWPVPNALAATLSPEQWDALRKLSIVAKFRRTVASKQRPS